MAAATRTKVNGYATPVAQKAISVWNEVGPSSYATGGYEVTLPNTLVGLRGIDWVGGGLDTTGAYEVIAGPISIGATGSLTFRVMWITANTGAEVSATTNLSTRSARMMAIGG